MISPSILSFLVLLSILHGCFLSSNEESDNRYIDNLVELAVLKAVHNVEKEVTSNIDHIMAKHENLISQLDDRVDERVDEIEMKLDNRLSQIERDIKDLADLKVALRIGLSVMGLVGISSIPQMYKLLQSAMSYLVRKLS
jgi:vacuolar-type H+-ATPase subunit I/STV1